MEGGHGSLHARGGGRLVTADVVVLRADVVVEAEPERVVERGYHPDLGHPKILKASFGVLQVTVLARISDCSSRNVRGHGFVAVARVRS